MKKRFLAFIVLIAVLCVAFSSFAEETEPPIGGKCGENLTWLYDKETKTLTISGSGDMSDYAPDVRVQVNYGVVAPWRKQVSNQNLQKVVISDGVTSIGEYAFYQCYYLTSVEISDSVTSIGNDAFAHCGDLTGITLPDGITNIGASAFLECVLTEVNYIGGRQNDWAAIEKGDKYSIDDSIIKYRAGIKAAFSDNGITAEPINIENGKTVILALYGGEKGDKFVEVQSKIYNDTEITFTPTKDYTRAKVMVWESFGIMLPVCGFKIIE